MKKVFCVLAFACSLGFSSIFLFSSADSNFSLFLQKFLPDLESSVPLVLVNAKIAGLSNSTRQIDFSNLENAAQTARELGAFACVSDTDFDSQQVSINSLLVNDKKPLQNGNFFFNIIHNFSQKNSFDSKSPEKFDPYLSVQRRHLVYKKKGVYFADLTFAQILESLNNPRVQISNSSIKFGDVEIPRAADGSVILKFPKRSHRDFKSISVQEIYDFARLEENFYEYLKIISERGFFGELNFENPFAVFEEARESQADLEKTKALKNKFYVLMKNFLSGKQERILLEDADDDEKEVIKKSFAVCGELFFELEARRENLKSLLDKSFCLIVPYFENQNDFIHAPLDSHFPKNLVPYLIANMIFSADFVDSVHPLVSLAIAFGLCLFFLLIACRIKKNLTMFIFSLVTILLSAAGFVWIFLFFRLYAGFFVPLSALLLLSLILNLACRKKNAETRAFFDNHFLQCVPESSIKQIISHPADFMLEGQKYDSTVMASSIAGFREIKRLFNETQLTAFLNYYFAKVSSLILESSGFVESYRNDRIVSLFGSPISLENHCAAAVKSAFAIKEFDNTLNQEIETYALSPKPDGMNDDLYTAFFILNHNKKKIMTRAGIYTASISAGCIGSAEKKSFRILDDSWKFAFKIKKAVSECGASGIFVNETASVNLRDSHILRSIPLKSFKSDEFLELHEVLGNQSDDDDKLWNYANYWNRAVEFLEKGENEKSLAIFEKLSEGRPNDKVARYFIKMLREEK